ncbi:hypothetical protein Tco_0778661 [Tanacetum coccineum]
MGVKVTTRGNGDELAEMWWRRRQWKGGVVLSCDGKPKGDFGLWVVRDGGDGLVVGGELTMWVDNDGWRRRYGVDDDGAIG